MPGHVSICSDELHGTSKESAISQLGHDDGAAAAASLPFRDSSRRTIVERSTTHAARGLTEAVLLVLAIGVYSVLILLLFVFPDHLGFYTGVESM